MNAIPAKNLSSQSRTLLARLKREKATCLTDPTGRPKAYLVAADTFDTIQSRLHLLEGIVRGEKAIREGRVYTQSEARKKLGRWLKK
jgi:predicted transcriptional regulator